MITKQEYDDLICEAYCEHFGPDARSSFRMDYENYFRDQAFSAFVSEMKTHYPEAYQKYEKGKGSELHCSTSNGKTTPPKMASIASSSRFCYLALRNGAQALGGNKVEFEYECRVDGIRGTAPQMDAHSAEGNIFIEAKCHEMFDNHTSKLSHQYYTWLCEKENGFALTLPKPKGNASIQLPLSVFGVDENPMFDLKQFLCHLMGIASASKGQPATLVYLYFQPQLADDTVQKQIDEIFHQLADEIHAVFTSDPIARFCRANRITLQAVAQHTSVMQALTNENICSLF